MLAQHTGRQLARRCGETAIRVSFEIRQETGKPCRPERKIRNGRPNGAGSALMHEVQNGGKQAKKAFVWLMRRQKMVAHLGKIVESDAGVEIFNEIELRLQQIARIQ